MRRIKRAPAVALTATLLSVTAACGGGGSTASNTDELLRVGISSEIPDLDPQVNLSDMTQLILFGNVYETLLVREPEGEVGPELSTSWEQVTPTKLRLELRSGVTFHNGDTFDADAVLYNFDRYFGGSIEPSGIGRFTSYDSISKVDPMTVEITLKRADPAFTSLLSLLPMIAPTALDSDPDVFSTGDAGSGPYSIDSVATDRVALARVSDHWGADGGPQEVEISARPELSSRVGALKAGELDIITDVTPDAAGEVPRLQREPGVTTSLIMVNAVDGVFTDPDLRRAAALAVDAEGIRQAFAEDTSSASQCQFGGEGTTGFVPDFDGEEFDPEQATQILEEKGAVGTTVSLSVPTGRFFAGEDISNVIAEQLEDVGFTVDLQVKDYNKWVEELVGPNDQKADMLYTESDHGTGFVSETWGVYISEDSPITAFPLDEKPALAGQMDAVKGELDESKAAELYEGIATELCDSNAFLQLFSVNQLYGTAEDVSFPVRADVRVPFTTVTTEGQN